jgi:hypothetical protein
MLSRFKEQSWLKQHHATIPSKLRGPSQVSTTLNEIEQEMVVKIMAAIVMIIDIA